jgi:hypothetical protein
MRLRLRGATLATPTLAIQSATGAAPLTLQWSDTDYVVGLYAQLQIDQTSNAFSNITQNIVFFIDGTSWALNDEAIGLVTPSGAYWARIRACRDNESGATAVTGFDPSGNAVSFNADASSWSNVVNDTISASSAALTSTAGTSCSKLLSVTGTPALAWHIPVGNGGAVELSRATISAANTDFYAEQTVGTLAARNYIGVTDNSIDFNGGTSGFFGGGTALPGDATFNGFTLELDATGTQVTLHLNGTTSSIAIGGTSTAGDIIGLRYNSSTNKLDVYYKLGAAAMAHIGTQQTITSLIPATPFLFAGGKNDNDAGTINFGASTFALGGTGPNGSPSGSNIYG